MELREAAPREGSGGPESLTPARRSHVKRGKLNSAVVERARGDQQPCHLVCYDDGVVGAVLIESPRDTLRRLCGMFAESLALGNPCHIGSFAARGLSAISMLCVKRWYEWTV